MLKKVFFTILVLYIALPLYAFETSKLDNGLTIITEQQKSASVVSLQLFVNVGSNNEKYSERGISHVIEHMVFKGSKRMSAGQISRAIQALGGNINAFTSFSMTSYYVTVPKENILTALDILADMVFYPEFNKKELEKEKKVILEEINMRYDNPSSRVHELLFSEVYPSCNIGNPIIGEKETVSSFTQENLKNYYRDFYTPNNMVIVAAGDFDEEKFIKKVKALTSIIQPNPVRQVWSSGIHRNAVATVNTIAIQGNIEQAYFAVGFKIPDFLNYDTAKLDVLSTILGSGASSRLYQVLMEDKRLVRGISAGIFSGNYPGVFIVSGVARSTDVTAALDEIIKQFALLKEKPISEQELSRVITQVKAAKVFEKEDVGSLTGQLGYYQLLHDASLKDEYEDQLSNVSTQDVIETANKYFVANNMYAAIYYPKKDKAILRNVNFNKSLAVLANAGEKNNVLNLQSKKPVARDIVLPNGVKVILKEDHSLPIVSFGAYNRSPFLSESVTDNGITDLAFRVAMKGTKNYKFDRISEIIDYNAISLSPYIDKNVAGFSGSSLSEKFPVLFDLFKEIVQSSTFEKEEVEKEKRLQLSSIQSRKEDSLGYASYMADKYLFTKLAYRMSLNGEETSVKNLQAEDVKKWFKRYVKPNQMIYVFVGDISEDQIRKLLVTYLSEKGEGQPVVPNKINEKELTGKIKQKLLLEKAQTAVVIKYRAPKVGSKDYYSMKVLNSILSGMGSRLFDKLREQEHLVYSADIYLSSGDPYSTLTAYALVSPGNETKAINLMQHEFDRLKTEAVNETELKKAKMVIKGGFAHQMQQRSDQAESYGRFEVLGMGYREVDNYLLHIDEVTVQDIKKVAEKYFSPRYVQIVVGK
ncbi:MAG TPA: hypothetical protein DF296_03130 [Candidatus Margulisbacteria bacterium]|nr:hypothetical protein [Candidatus Margulisiibacteriota bacterium]